MRAKRVLTTFICPFMHATYNWVMPCLKCSYDTFPLNFKQCHIVWKLLKMSHFQFWHFLPIFVLLKLTYLVTLFDQKLQVFKNLPKWTNVNVARFARNVEWDFFCDFQTPCTVLSIWKEVEKKTRNSVTPYRRPVDHQTVDFKNLLLLVNHFYLPSCGASKQQ